MCSGCTNEHKNRNNVNLVTITANIKLKVLYSVDKHNLPRRTKLSTCVYQRCVDSKAKITLTISKGGIAEYINTQIQK